MMDMLLRLDREVPRLDILLYHSFAYPLLSVEPHRVAKVHGVAKGLEIELRRGSLIIHSPDLDNRVVRNIVYELLGCWCSVSSAIGSLDSSLRSRIREVVKAYRWIGVSTCSVDDVEIFASIALSRNTDFHRNVVGWMRRLLEYLGRIDRVSEMSGDDVVSIVGVASYQLRQLPPMIRAYMSIRRVAKSASDEDAHRVRRLIMNRVPFAGPKVADSVLLFIAKNPLYAPVDKNLIRFIELLDLGDVLGYRAPEKHMCIRYSCDECPRRDSCISNLARRALGKFFAVFQTIAYTHVGLWCRKGLCHSCPLRSVCRRS